MTGRGVGETDFAGSATASRWTVHGPWLLIAFAAALVYANSIANGFALDDNFIIEHNARVHQLSDQGAIWLTPYWPTFGEELGLYRPLTIFAYAVEWAVSGGAPWFFHLCNVLMHAGISVLAYLLIRLLIAPVPALIGALVFAVHPVHTEAVANVVGQAELIAGLATVGAALVYAARPPGPSVGWARRGALLVLFSIGVLAKESAIVLPALLVALDVAQRRVCLRRASIIAYGRAVAMPMFLFVAVSALYLAIRVDVLGSLGGVNAAPNLPFLREDARLLTAFRAWPEYARLLFFPADLSADYSPGVILPVERLAGLSLLGLVLLAFAVALSVATPWLPVAGLAAAWFLISILPTSNLLLPVGIVVAERTLYTPSLAAAFAVAAAWDRMVPVLDMQLRPVRAAVFALAACVLLMGARTVSRNPDWDSLRAVWHSLIRDHPESYRSQWAMGALTEDFELRLDHMAFADRLWPYDAALQRSLALEYLKAGRQELALEALERALSFVDFDPIAHLLVAHTYLGQGRFGEAVQSAHDAHRRGAPAGAIYPLLAHAYDRMGNRGEAIAAWRLAVRESAPNVWPYRAYLARALARERQMSAALAFVDSAVAHAPHTDTATQGGLQRLRDAIRRGCYEVVSDDSHAPGEQVLPECVDPLRDWGIPLLLPRAENASSSQNATESAVEAG